MLDKFDNSIIRNCVLDGVTNCEFVKNYGNHCCSKCIISRFRGLGFKYLICAYKRYVDYNKNRRIPF